MRFGLVGHQHEIINIYQNYSVLKILASPNFQNISQLRCFTQPMLKPTSNIEVPQAKNDLAKFCDDPTMFGPLITGLKITSLVPRNLDRFPVLLFLCITHCGVCSARFNSPYRSSGSFLTKDGG